MAFSYVGHGSTFTYTTVTSVALSNGLTYQPGDLIIATVTWQGYVLPDTITVSDGTTSLTMLTQATAGGYKGSTICWAVASASGSAKIFTVTTSAGIWRPSVTVAVFRPAGTASIGQYAGSSGTSTSGARSTASVNTTTSDELAVSVFEDYSEPAWNSPLINGVTPSAITGQWHALFYTGLTSPVTGLVSTVTPATQSSPWTAYIATFIDTTSSGNDSVTPSNIATPSPTIGQTTLSQDHGVAPVGLSATPSVGTTSLTQNHALTASSITLSAPVVGSFALSQNHALAPASLATASPSLGNPTVTSSSTDKSVSPVSISTGSPSVGQTSVTQNHVLSPASISTTSPVVGNPTLSSAAGNNSVTPSSIATPAPTMGTTVLQQNHSIAPLSLSTTPVVGALSLSQNHVLVFASVLSGVPAIGHPTVTVQDPTQVKVNTLDLSFMVISDINTQLSAYNDVSFVMQSFSEVSV